MKEHKPKLRLLQLKDQSKGYTNTTQLINKTANIIDQFIQVNFVDKFLDLGTFIYRTHFHNFIDSFGSNKNNF